MKRLMSVGFACMLVVGCATSNLDRLVPGSITLEQMRAKEKPTAEWKNSDGSVTLEYSRRPATAKNVMLDFDLKGVLSSANAVSTPENMAKLKTGMTRAEVQRLVGSPAMVLQDSANGGDLWVIPMEQSGGADFSQSVMYIYWHPRVDGAMKIEEGNRFD